MFVWQPRQRTSNFHCEVFCYHAVSCSKVSVNKLVGIEVCHPISNLSCHLNHLLQSWRCLARILLSKIKKIKQVREKGKKRPISTLVLCCNKNPYLPLPGSQQLSATSPTGARKIQPRKPRRTDAS